MTKNIRILLLFVLIFSISLIFSSIAFADSEPNNNFNQSEAIGQNSTVSGTVSPSSDYWDTYSLSSPSSTPITISLSGNLYDSWHDTALYIYDSSFNLVAEHVTSYTIPPYSSTYYIRVNCGGVPQTGPYSYTLSTHKM
jgi:hypothetical protein